MAKKSHTHLWGVNELFIHPYRWTNDSFTPRWMIKYSFDKASLKRKIYSVCNPYWILVGWLNKSSPSLGALTSGIFHWHFYCLLISVIEIIYFLYSIGYLTPICFQGFCCYFCLLLLGLVIHVHLVFWLSTTWLTFCKIFWILDILT